MEKAGEEIETKLRSEDLAGAWDTAKRWYRQASGRPPKPMRADLARVTREYQELGTRRILPLENIVVLAPRFDIHDDPPD